MRFASLRISTRLFLLNVMIFAAFMLVLGVILFSFRDARESLYGGARHDISRAIARSGTTRSLSQLFSDIEIMSHAHFDWTAAIATEKEQLGNRILSIASGVENAQLKTALDQLIIELVSLLDDRGIVYILLNHRAGIEKRLLTELGRLEEWMSGSMTGGIPDRRESLFATRMLPLAAGYRNCLLLSEKAFHKALYGKSSTTGQLRMTEVLAELARVTGKWQADLASAPEGNMTRLRTQIAEIVQEYREVLVNIDHAASLYRIQLNRVNRTKQDIEQILQAMDEDASQTLAAVSKSIDDVFFSAGTIMILLSLMVVGLLAVGTNIMFHRMINRPMSLLRSGLKSFGAGVSSARLNLGRSDDWRFIELAFNNMADDLSSSYLALSNSEKKFRELAELLPQPVFELDREGAITFSNRRVSEIFGYDSQELVDGFHIYQLIDPPRIDQMHGIVRTVLAGSEIKGEETAILHRNGSLVPVRIYCAPICDPEGVTGIRGTVVDITAHKKAEKELAQHRDLLEVLVEKRTVALRRALAELRESEELYRNLTTQMHDGFIILDEYLMLDYVNPRIQELLGYERAELLNMHISDFHTPENAATMNEMFYRMRKTGEIVRFETVLHSRQGKEIALMVSSRPEIRDGRIKRVYAVCTDITRLKQSEKALKENQENLEEKIRMRTRELEIARDKAEKANQLKNEFLANVSHELRTPMHAILSYSKYGIRKIDVKSKERIKEYFTNIHHSGKRLLVFLNDLLDLSSLQAEKMEYDMQYLDLRRTFREMKAEVLPLLQEKELYLTIDPEPPIIINYDNLKIKQVISNLLNNAIKFSEPGSDIIVDFREEPDRITVMVKNRGIRVPEQELRTIFDPFVQSSMTKTGAGGTGLGLPICKKIINHHGGDIWAEKDDTGATFRFFLPK